MGTLAIIGAMVGTLQGGLYRAIQAMFAASEKGVWYDPSDMQTLFQDSAGTTPVTAVTQPVGLMLDKAGNGYHATQSTSTARPLLGREPVGGRRNLLTYTEDVSNGAWTKNGSITAPTATTILAGSAASSVHNIQQLTTHAAGSRKISARVTYINNQWLALGVYDGAWRLCLFDIVAGAVGSADTGLVGAITSVSAGVYDISVAVTTGASTYTGLFIQPSNTLAPSWTASGTESVGVTRLSSTVGSDLTYQKVVSALDVTEAGVNDAYYLKFDGVDDFMVTPSIDFSATDKMSVFAGVYRANDIIGTVCELSATWLANAGTFIHAVGDTTKDYSAVSRGSATYNALQGSSITQAGPETAVFVATHDIAGDSTVSRRNGVAGVAGTGDKGTGNFGNYPLYIGRRGGTSLPFNGHLYSLVVRGALSDAAQITAAEAYANSKTGAY